MIVVRCRMHNSDNEYDGKEVMAEAGEPEAAVEFEIPKNVPDNPESQSPVPWSPAASHGPAFAVAEEKAFGGAELQICSSGRVERLQE